MTNLRIEITRTQVLARNLLNLAILDWVPAMRQALAPFIGQKICKVDGTLLKKVHEVLPPSVHDIKLQIYYSTGAGYSLTAGFKVGVYCGENQYGWRYAEATVYLCDLANGVMSRLYNFEPLNYRTDYTLDEVLSLQGSLRTAKEQVSEYQMKLDQIL